MTNPRDTAITAMLGVTLEDGRQLSEVEAGRLVDAAMGVARAMATGEVIEHCAALAEVHCDAWRRKQQAAKQANLRREYRDSETMAIAAVHIAAAIRALANNGERHD